MFVLKRSRVRRPGSKSYTLWYEFFYGSAKKMRGEHFVIAYTADTKRVPVQLGIAFAHIIQHRQARHLRRIRCI